MAKGNMLLGQARGKVGDVVFSRNNGQQVIRARSAVVKNPQTNKQILQRILLNTVSQAYSLMAPICDHSYEGVQTGQQSMAQFMRLNLNQIRGRVVAHKNNTGSLSGFYAVTPIGSKKVALNPYILSVGTLPMVPVTALSLAEAGNEVAQITLPGVTEDITYADIISAYGLQRGDQLTFVNLTQQASGDITFNYCRVILDPTDEYGLPAPLSSEFIADGAILFANERNAGQFARLTENSGVISFSVAGGIPVAAAVIVSRESEQGKWLRSNSVMLIPTNITAWSQTSLLDAIDAFYSGGISMDSAWYLNNAEQSAAGSQSSTTAQPTIQSLVIAGRSAFAEGYNVAIAPQTAAPVRLVINNFNAAENCKLILTTRTLSVGDLYDSQGGDIVIPANSSSVETAIDLSTEGAYKIYFVSGGFVRRAHAVINVSQSESPAFTSATFAGTNLLTNETIQSISSGEQGQLVVAAANVDSMASAKVAVIKSNTQPSVGDTISSPLFQQTFTNGSASGTFSFADTGMHYLLLVNGSTILQVASAINVQEVSGPPSSTGGGEG